MNDDMDEFSQAITRSQVESICRADPDACEASDVYATWGSILVCEVVVFFDPCRFVAVALVWCSREGGAEHGCEAYATSVVPA